MSSQRAPLQAWESEPCILGIDEAGRGPVLGAMVYGAAWCPLAREADVKALGFMDSKQLTPDQRAKLLVKIQQSTFMGHRANVISPESMSHDMLRRQKGNLNTISHNSGTRRGSRTVGRAATVAPSRCVRWVFCGAAIDLIQVQLDRGVNLVHCYIDTVGDPGRYETLLRSVFHGIDFTVCSKADSLFAIVSAASIVAKETRDAGLEAWVFPEQQRQQLLNRPATDLPFARSFGSGYPGDEKTKAWLTSHIDRVYGFPSLVRFCWATTKKMLLEKALLVDWGDRDSDDDEDGDAGPASSSKHKGPPPPKQAKLSASFLAGDRTKSTRADARHAFFKSNALHQVAAANSPF